MKSRTIIQRNSFYRANELQYCNNYTCFKQYDRRLSPEDFWYDAVVWRWDEDFDIRFNIMDLPHKIIKAGSIAAIVNNILFPSVKFNGSFSFAKRPLKNVIQHSYVCYDKPFDFQKII